jgi:pyruvate ferredoxin oxidoreductase gamma subunit
VLTSLKIADEKIYDLSDSESPAIVIVLDHSILADESVLQGLKPGGTLIINTPYPPERYTYDGITVAVADVTAISGEAELTYGTVSSGIIGAFAKASPLVKIDTLAEVIREEFEGRKPEENARAALLTYARTRCSEVQSGNKRM